MAQVEFVISIVDKNVVKSELNYFFVQFLMNYKFLGSIFDIILLQNLFTKWQ